MANRRNVGRDEVVPLSNANDDGYIASSDDRPLCKEISLTVSASISDYYEFPIHAVVERDGSYDA
jgi:hypothetical protein